MARRARVVVVALILYLGVAALFLIAVSALLHGGPQAGAALGPSVAVVELDGIILDVRDLLEDLRTHRDNPRVRAVVIRIESPGGVVAPTQEVHRALLRLREAGKPVVASIGAMAASGGYYVAVAADRIYASPGSLTGSIGVIFQLPNFEGLMKKIGVDYVVVKAGRFKDIGNVARPMSEGERRVLQTLLDDVHGQFIGAVAAGRKLDEETVRQFADGRVFSGSQALDLKMVDELGGLEEAVNGAAELAGLRVPPPVIGPRRRFSLSEFLRSQLGLAGLASLPALPPVRMPLYLMD